MRQSTLGLFLLYGIGLLGVEMRRFAFPAGQAVAGMVLGLLAEAQKRNAVAIGEGSWSIFSTWPMSLTLVRLVPAVLLLPRLLRRVAQRQNTRRMDNT